MWKSHLRWALLFVVILNKMTSIKNEMQAMCLFVADDLAVTVIPNSNHEFLMSSEDVGRGYGIAACTIRRHIQLHSDEFTEGIHYLRSVQILNTSAQMHPQKVFWTKAGVIRLGFFIKSERAKLFRDWAEQLILAFVGHKQPSLPAVIKRKHNRLTQERIIDILADVCLIENRELRERIANKIMGVN